MNTEMHIWCEVELQYYTWTMQYVWFDGEDDRQKFIKRWLYPTWELSNNDHAYGIQINDYSNDGSDLLNQMNALGANFNPNNHHAFFAPAAAMMQDFSDGEFPPKAAVWVGATYDQAMIGRMCGLEFIETPPLSVVGVDPKAITREQAVDVRDERLRNVYGVVLPLEKRRNRI